MSVFGMRLIIILTVQHDLNKLCGRPPQYAPAPLTLKVVSKSRVTWATSVPILVFLFLYLSVLDLGLMYAGQTSDRQMSDSIIA